MTNRKGRISAGPLRSREQDGAWTDVIRKAGNIAGRGNRRRQIVATHMKDVAAGSVYSLTGQMENDIMLPGVGTTAALR